jgi:hypothetical protein
MVFVITVSLQSRSIFFLRRYRQAILVFVLFVAWEKPYSEVCGYVNNARMSIAIVRATTAQQPSLSPRISYYSSDEQNVQPTPAVGGSSRPRSLPTLVPQQYPHVVPISPCTTI